MFRFSLLTLLFLACAPFAHAQSSGVRFIDFDDVTICSAEPAESAPPAFSSEACESRRAEDIDPQGQLIWVRARIDLDQTSGQNGEPLALYISGKMASEVYLNGVFVGANGKPGADAETEIPGKMDAELFPPQELFRVGENEVVLRASAQHGFIKLYRPVHVIGIAPAGFFAHRVLPSLGPALVTLGLFLLGGLYFGVTAVIGSAPIRSANLSAICLFAGGQLISESLRGLISYDYPIHDLRLLAIALFSLAFGLSVAFHIFRTFMPTGAVRWIGGIAVVALVAVMLVKGFDFKSLVGMTIPLVGALAATGHWTYKGRTRAFVHFLGLLVFLGAIALFLGFFLDTVFFLLVAFFLLLLFLEQALLLNDEARQRRSEEARANRLEQALAEAEERADSSHINVKSAGKIERIATSHILHCKGAGGYSEIVLTGGRTLLHSASLNEMEETLPATFLRVHRSHLINVMSVKSLKRDPAGTGTLIMEDDVSVPVSRRIMPKVRQALG